ncbi:hypothetical protein BC831DRAFT_440006 [Entophlyctis helioformis]|nr:hypothetical protein BC831DRAFT_440006 [Entophlyctis helioformis]
MDDESERQASAGGGGGDDETEAAGNTSNDLPGTADSGGNGQDGQDGEGDSSKLDDGVSAPSGANDAPAGGNALSPSAVPLTIDLISKSLSLIARTGTGLSHAYTRLEIHGKGITNLEAIDKFPHLRYVDCSDNALLTIEALASLEFLLSVNVQGNQLRDIPPVLDKKKYLQHINVAKNQLQEFKIQSWPIASFVNLNDNQLKDLVLEDFPELMHLEARANKLKDTGRLNTPKIQRLYLGGNEVASLTNLDTIPTLQLLHLRANKIESLDGLSSKLTSLTYLNLRSNKVATLAEVDKLKVLPALRILILAENPVDQVENYRLEVVMRLGKLERLDKEMISPEEREDANAALEEARESQQ